jgi:hypothetical protein
VLSLDLLLSIVAGCVLYILSSRTDTYFAWTIKLPVTAAFLGAGYLGAVVTLLPTYRMTEWRRVRIIAVMGFVLTATTAIVTLWHLGEFHLNEGSATARVAAWAWLAVYLTVPVLLASAFFRQERAGGRMERVPALPLPGWLRALTLGQAAASTVIGFGLVVWPSGFDVVWPWPLPALAAGAVAAWLLTTAAGSWWLVREGDWQAIRSSVPGLVVYLLLIVVATARYHGSLDAHRWQTWTFFGAIALTLATFAAAAWSLEAGPRSTVKSRTVT